MNGWTVTGTVPVLLQPKSYFRCNDECGVSNLSWTDTTATRGWTSTTTSLGTAESRPQGSVFYCERAYIIGTYKVRPRQYVMQSRWGVAEFSLKPDGWGCGDVAVREFVLANCMKHKKFYDSKVCTSYRTNLYQLWFVKITHMYHIFVVNYDKQLFTLRWPQHQKTRTLFNILLCSQAVSIDMFSNC
jgi:hypothetical protein